MKFCKGPYPRFSLGQKLVEQNEHSSLYRLHNDDNKTFSCKIMQDKIKQQSDKNKHFHNTVNLNYLDLFNSLPCQSVIVLRVERHF